jgi:hypothetical protein
MLTRLVFYAVVTWIVEALILLILLRFLPGRAKRSDLRYWTDILLVNAFTNPLTNLAIFWGVPFAVAETVVVLVEWPLYRAVLGLTWKQGLLASVIANGVTMALSFVL